MLYLILSAGLEEDSTVDGGYRLSKFLKIGYTEEEEFDLEKNKRMRAYRTDNPSFIVLGLIPGGTQSHEKALHYMFNDRKFRTEWFHYSQDIIDLFISVKTVEELDKYVVEWTVSKISKNETDFKKLVHGFCKRDNLSLAEALTVYDEIITGKSSIFSKFSSESFNVDEIYSLLEDANIFDYNFHDKMFEVCSKLIKKDTTLEELYESNQLPISHLAYINLLGPEKIRANSYHESRLRELVSDIRNSDNLSDLVLSEFEVGRSYSLKYIKECLKNIYDGLGINKSPKASDLEIYFEVKSVLISEEGKRLRGYQIVKRK